MKITKKHFTGFFVLLAFTLAVSIGGCMQQQGAQDDKYTDTGADEESPAEGQDNGQAGEQQDKAGQQGEIPGKFNLEEVSKHSTKDDCWIVIDQKVYDVTGFVNSHPGGKAILEGCGKDATELFETRPMGSGTAHSQNARNRLDKYYIGEFEK